MLGDEGLQEYTYKKIEDKKNVAFKATNAWLGITDKYWAATLLPDTDGARCRRTSRPAQLGTLKTYQTDYLLDAADRRAGRDRRGQRAAVRRRQGSRTTVDAYNKQLGLNHFDLLIDWGWFYFITKPMFFAIDWLLPAGRQFRHRHPARHRARQDRSSSRSPTSPTPRWRR